MNSFPSKYCGDVMSINCLLFICMLHSLQYIQNKYFHNQQNKFKKDSGYKLFTISSFNNHCFNGNMYFGANIWYIFRHIKILSYLIIIIPLIFTLYIGCIQIIEYKHFIIDVIIAYIIGIFTSFLSFSIFKNSLLHNSDIMSLSEIMRLCIQAKNNQNTSSTQCIASPKRFKNRSFSLTNKKKKYPSNPIYGGELSSFPMTFGMNTNDYNLNELEDIALQIGTNNNSYHTIDINNGTHTPILTDDDGIEIDTSNNDEDTLDESINSSTETVSIDKHLHNNNNNKKICESRKNNDSVTERKNKLLYKHRKSIKLRLAPPSSKLSQNSSKISPLSFNNCNDNNINNIITPFNTNNQSICTPISPLSAPQSVTSYNDQYTQ